MTNQARKQETSELGWEHEQERRAPPPGLLDSGMLFARSAQLTCEGALRLLFSTSAPDVWDRLVRAGLEWEDEYTRVSEHGGRQRGERA
jgi:hypothetical protein